jgi:hypothetical protein
MGANVNSTAGRRAHVPSCLPQVVEINIPRSAGMARECLLYDWSTIRVCLVERLEKLPARRTDSI